MAHASTLCLGGDLLIKLLVIYAFLFHYLTASDTYQFLPGSNVYNERMGVGFW